MLVSPPPFLFQLCEWCFTALSQLALPSIQIPLQLQVGQRSVSSSKIYVPNRPEKKSVEADAMPRVIADPSRVCRLPSCNAAQSTWTSCCTSYIGKSYPTCGDLGLLWEDKQQAPEYTAEGIPWSNGPSHSKPVSLPRQPTASHHYMHSANLLEILLPPFCLIGS